MGEGVLPRRFPGGRGRGRGLGFWYMGLTGPGPSLPVSCRVSGGELFDFLAQKESLSEEEATSFITPRFPRHREMRAFVSCMA